MWMGAAHLTQQVGESFCHAAAALVEADESQVSAVGVQVVEALLLELAARSRALGSVHRGLTQGCLQDPQGSQNVFT